MKPASVVLIEDHTLVRHLLAAVLKDEPGVVLAGDFATVAAGIKGCLKLHPALVIIDWMMPDGKGIDVVRALATKLAGTRYLFLSSLEKEHVVQEAIEAGVDGFVMKREPYEVLLEAIRAVLAGRSFYCPTSSRLLIEALRSAANSGINALTVRERDILRGIARGDSIKVMADRFGVSPKTVNNQLGALKEKLGLRDTVPLVRYAINHGLVEDF
jgi:DNA-binding NarL/FixJ family response regulator